MSVSKHKIGLLNYPSDSIFAEISEDLRVDYIILWLIGLCFQRMLKQNTQEKTEIIKRKANQGNPVI